MSEINDGRKRELEQYEAVLETIDEAVFIVGEEWTIEYANESALMNADTTLEDLRGTPVMRLTEQMVVGEDVDRFEAALGSAFDDEEDPIRVELNLKLPTGQKVAEYRLSPRYDDGETVTSVVVVARDVTERVNREETLRQREAQLSRLHDATHDLLGADSPERAAEIASNAAEDILDLPMNGIHFYEEAADGLVPVVVSEATRALLGEIPVIDDGIAWETFQRGESRVYDDLTGVQEVYNPETPMRSEIHLPLGDHGVFIISSPDVDAFDDGDVRLAQTLAANTEAALERITREGELRTREAELVRKNERLDQFASVISHDLRNPLNVAQGRLELARDTCESEYLDGVASAHERMDALIDSLLALAREGDAVDDPAPVDLAEIVEGCWRNVPTADATRVVGTDQTIRADPARLKQLLENLFRNAVEHGGEDVTITVGDPTDEDGFYITDDGPGIPPDKREDVFEAGYSTADESTGFGLTIVKEIVDAHDWDISVIESEAGGARFNITDVDVVDE